MIPLQNGVTSVGTVCMPDYLKTRTGNLDEFFEATVRLCPKAWDVVKNGVAPVSWTVMDLGERGVAGSFRS